MQVLANAHAVPAVNFPVKRAHVASSRLRVDWTLLGILIGAFFKYNARIIAGGRWRIGPYIFESDNF